MGGKSIWRGYISMIWYEVVLEEDDVGDGDREMGEREGEGDGDIGGCWSWTTFQPDSLVLPWWCFLKVKERERTRNWLFRVIR